MHGTIEPESVIRPITEDDLDWVMALAKTRYQERDYSEGQMRAWIAARLKEPSMYFVRGRHTAGCCHLARRYMAPTRWQAYLTIIASIPSATPTLEPFRVFKALVDWSREKGATMFHASDVTGFDLGPWCRALGGREVGKQYVIDLDGKAGRYG